MRRYYKEKKEGNSFIRTLIMLLLLIVLILLSLFGRFFDYDKRIMRWTIGFTAIAAALEIPRVAGAAALKGIADWAAGWLPLYSVGLGWVVPAAIGLAIGFILRASRKAA